MHDLTTGSLVRHLLRTASFMLVAMVFQTLYFLVDLYWVGRLGSHAVAGVAVAGNLQFVVLALSQMLGVGTTTAVSHAVGRRDGDAALLAFNQSQVMSMAAGLAFLAVGMATRVGYATAQGADGETAAMAAEYLAWFIPAMALQFCAVAMGAALRGSGNFRIGTIVQVVTVGVNIVLAPALMFGWGTGRPLGVAGAAVATFVAVAISVIWLAVYFRLSDTHLQFAPSLMRPQFAQWWGMLKVGLPAGAEFALMAVTLFVVYRITRDFGSEAQAAFGIGSRVVQALFMPVVALAFAVAPVAGQNFGAGHTSRVIGAFRIGVAMSAGVMAVATLLSQIAPAPLVGLFSSDPSVVALGVEYLRIVSLAFIASGVGFVSSSMFQAMGNTVPPLLASVARVLLFTVPAVALVPVPGFELWWLWCLSALSTLMHCGIVLAVLQREFRRRLPSPAPVTVSGS